MDHWVVLDEGGPEPHLRVAHVDEGPISAPGERVPNLLGELVPRRPLRVEFPYLGLPQNLWV
jgi:hypothetical protein